MKLLVNGLCKALAVVCAALFTILVLTTVWQVFSRLVLNSPVTWSEELAKVVFVWLSFLGASLVYGSRGHMAVEMLARRFPDKGERFFGIWTHVVGLFFGLFVMVYGGFKAALNAWTQNLTALPLNIGSIYLVIPLAGVCISLFALNYIKEISRHETSAFPVPEAELEAAKGQEIAEEALETEAELVDAAAPTKEVEK